MNVTTHFQRMSVHLLNLCTVRMMIAITKKLKKMTTTVMAICPPDNRKLAFNNHFNTTVLVHVKDGVQSVKQKLHPVCSGMI